MGKVSTLSVKSKIVAKSDRERGVAHRHGNGSLSNREETICLSRKREQPGQEFQERNGTSTGGKGDLPQELLVVTSGVFWHLQEKESTRRLGFDLTKRSEGAWPYASGPPKSRIIRRRRKKSFICRRTFLWWGRLSPQAEALGSKGKTGDCHSKKGPSHLSRVSLKGFLCPPSLLIFGKEGVIPSLSFLSHRHSLEERGVLLFPLGGGFFFLKQVL